MDTSLISFYTFFIHFITDLYIFYTFYYVIILINKKMSPDNLMSADILKSI